MANKLKYMSVVLIAAMIFISSGLGNILFAAEIVDIPDANLEQAIRDELNKPTGEITKTDMERLTKFRVLAKGVKDITGGLEYATNLYRLDLAWNEITDLTPLEELINLKELYLPDNNISDIAPLAGLTNLRFLELNRNSISNLEPETLET